MHLICSTEASLVLSTIPKHSNACIPYWHKFTKIPMQKKSVLAVTTIHEQPFQLNYCGTGNLRSASSVAQIMGWMVQKFPQKQLQKLLQLLCVVCVFTVMLKDHTSQHIICNTWETADSTPMREWKWT